MNFPSHAFPVVPGHHYRLLCASALDDDDSGQLIVDTLEGIGFSGVHFPPFTKALADTIAFTRASFAEIERTEGALKWSFVDATYNGHEPTIDGGRVYWGIVSLTDVGLSSTMKWAYGAGAVALLALAFKVLR